MTWEGVGGFLCHWHLIGPFDSGLAVDPTVHLFDAKDSPGWGVDHLGPWGGAAAVRRLPLPSRAGAAPTWQGELLPLAGEPVLSLRRAGQEYPRWQQLLAGCDSDTWSRLYYALALVHSPRAGGADLWFSGWDGCRLWVNGREAFGEHSYHHVILDHERVGVALARGVNSFLFQLDRDGVVARLATPDRPGLLRELRGLAVGPTPQPRRVGTVVALRRLAWRQKVRQPFRGRTARELKAWQRSFGRHYHRCLGPLPAPGRWAGRGRMTEEVACEGYVRRRYELPAEEGCVVPAYVLLPDRDRFHGRTLILAHGHESYKRVVGADGRGVDPHKPLNNYGQRLAQKGFLVAVACERAFTDRNDNALPADACNVAAAMASAMGLTLPRLHILDLHRLYELTMRLPQADPARTGLSGLSGGGTLTYLAGAFDDRFRAVGVFCGMTRYRNYAAVPAGCGMQVVPGVFPTGDVGEILSLIAPRPLLLAQGRLDETFNVLELRTLAADARRAYRAAGAEDRLAVSVFERPHVFDVDVAEAFFTRWL